MKLRTLILALAMGPIATPAWAGAQQGGRELEGVIDLHVHADPAASSRGRRSVNVFEAAELARRHGMRAMVIKNHYTETASQAYLVSQIVPGIEVYGGIVLNRAVGGINPVAVENMATITGGLGRIVWLPTFDSENNAPDGDNVPITGNGALLPEVDAVLEVMGRYDLALATGHVAPEEGLLAIRAARAAGIDRIIVTHPASGAVGMSLELQKEAASLGALLEYTILSVMGGRGSLDDFATQIREVGPENVVITSDLGQSGNPSHADGMRTIIRQLQAAGFSEAEVDLMIERNPARLLGID